MVDVKNINIYIDKTNITPYCNIIEIRETKNLKIYLKFSWHNVYNYKGTITIRICGYKHELVTCVLNGTIYEIEFLEYPIQKKMVKFYVINDMYSDKESINVTHDIKLLKSSTYNEQLIITSKVPDNIYPEHIIVSIDDNFKLISKCSISRETSDNYYILVSYLRDALSHEYEYLDKIKKPEKQKLLARTIIV